MSFNSQACAVVHTARHAIGYALYDLTALIYKYGIENCKDVVEQRKQEYIEKIRYWNEHLCDYQGIWADFMAQIKFDKCLYIIRQIPVYLVGYF